MPSSFVTWVRISERLSFKSKLAADDSIYAAQGGEMLKLPLYPFLCLLALGDIFYHAEMAWLGFIIDLHGGNRHGDPNDCAIGMKITFFHLESVYLFRHSTEPSCPGLPAHPRGE